MSDQTRVSLNELLTKLNQDETFRQELLAQPAVALQAAGYALEAATPEVIAHMMCSQTCSISCNRPTCQVTCASTEA